MSINPQSKNLLLGSQIHPLHLVHTLLKNNPDPYFILNIGIQDPTQNRWITIDNLRNLYQTTITNPHNFTIDLILVSMTFTHSSKIYTLSQPIPFTLSNSIETPCVSPTFSFLGYTPEYFDNQLTNLQNQITSLQKTTKYTSTYHHQ